MSAINQAFEKDEEKNMHHKENLYLHDFTTKKIEKDRPQDFDELLDTVGSTGRFQKWFLYAILGTITAITPLFTMNTIFLLSEPDHWCAPGSQLESNMSLDLWKSLNLPKIIGPDGKERLSQCSMYSSPNNKTIVDCQYGWNYDKTNYESTIPTSYDWVCSKGKYATNAFTVQTVGAVAGVLIFGHLSDKIGRRPVFFIVSVLDAVFRIASLFLVYNYNFYLICTFLIGVAQPLLFLTPTLIAAEISGKDYRAWIFSWTWVIWVVGMGALPFFAWVTRTWFLFGMLTSASSALIFLTFPFIPESPRFLYRVGRIEDAAKNMQKIAKMNGKTESNLEELETCLKYLHTKENEMEGDVKGRNGVWSIFSKRRLAINTIMLCISWSVNKLVYYGITLNSSHMIGNEFLIFFILAVIEIPSGFAGGWMVEKFGRRFTSVFFFLICGLSCFAATTAVVSDSLNSIITITSMVIAKFAITATFLVVYMQGTEIFPTTLRSTGSSFASMVATGANVLGPYMIYSGKINVNLPYISMGIVSIMGVLAASFIPETLNRKLPNSIMEANELGKSDKFWTIHPEREDNRPIRKICKSNDTCNY